MEAGRHAEGREIGRHVGRQVGRYADRQMINIKVFTLIHKILTSQMT